jgi:hypothetical protein
VGQVTGAMNHLSASTQQAASASEELSATAEELSAQAAELQELMGFFQVQQDDVPTLQRAAPLARAAQATAIFRPAPARPVMPRTRARISLPA